MDSKVDAAALPQMPPYQPDSSSLAPLATGASRTVPSTSPNISNLTMRSTPSLVSPLESSMIPLEDVDLTSRTLPVALTTPDIAVEAAVKSSTVGVTVGQHVAEGDCVEEESDREDFEHQAKADEDTRYPDSLIPIPLPKKYPEINFVPLFLNYRVLTAILVFNVLCICSILSVLYCADSKHQYHSKYENIHLILRYIPTVVGTLTTMLFRCVRDTFARMQPYISMADQGYIRECGGSKSLGQPFIRGMGKKSPSTREHRHCLRYATKIGSNIVVMIAGFKASLFSTAHSEEGWLITVHYQIAWVLISIYLCIIPVYCWMLLKMRRAQTGLKWDPARIVDLLALFHGSNVLDDFKLLELRPRKMAWWLLSNKNYRLGYWEKGVNKDIWYGIGRKNVGSEPPPETHNTDIHRDVADESARPSKDAVTYMSVPLEDENERTSETDRGLETSIDGGRDGERLPFCGRPLAYDCKRYPWDRIFLYQLWTVYFWVPFVLSTIILCIYGIASGVVKRGFNIPAHTPFTNSSTPGPFTYNITTDGGDVVFANFDPGNNVLWVIFIFRTVIVILSSYLAVVWFDGVDKGMRFMQPFKNMYNAPATADDSILLDYLWDTPGLITIKAVMNKHYKVAWFSFITFFSHSFPVIAGGLFTITNTGKRIYFSITPITFYLAFAYLIIYGISIPIAWPGRNRRLMRWHDSMADYVSLFYASYLIHDPNSKLDISAPDVTKRHLEYRVFLEEKKYSVGLYNGYDGKSHFGMDVAVLPSLNQEKKETQHVFFWPYEEADWDWKKIRREEKRQDRRERRGGYGIDPEDNV
ncbi:hypothetical protein BDZ45DRAFT_691403 [Acephala macrosclerotiorum]|nr:hypothetical protein BDZ45DRAFT_691403 [Acephala macrosclerotiorum]